MTQGPLQAKGPASGEPSIGSMAFPRIARCVVVALACTLCTAATASAAPVLVMRGDGSVVAHRHSPAPDVTFPAVRSAADQQRSEPIATLAAKRRTVVGELDRLRAAGAIDDAAYAERRAAYEDAKRTVKKLSGARRVELGAVVSTLEDIAARGQLTASRLAPLFLTLQRNREWWTTGPLLAPGRRVGFAGSELVWQYYPGHGIQIQVLGTFGKLNALWSSRQTHRARPALLDELLPLAAERAGGVAWEYYFPFAAGKRAVGLEPRPGHRAAGARARGDAAQAPGRGVRRSRAAGWAIFEQRRAGGRARRRPAPARTTRSTPSSPALRILNGFIQSLVGLYDYGRAGGRRRARRRCSRPARRAPARRCRPTTPAPGRCTRAGRVTHESDLGYHTLLRDFLDLAVRPHEDRDLLRRRATTSRRT